MSSRRQDIDPDAESLGISIEEARRLAAALAEPDLQFINQRIAGVGKDEIEDAFRAAHIALLRSDVPLSRVTRILLSNELSRLYWPKHHARRGRETRATRDCANIDAIARVLQAKGIPNARGEAEKEWARMQRVTVGALRQRRYRKPPARKRRRKA
jgi:hypothetical protein